MENNIQKIESRDLNNIAKLPKIALHNNDGPEFDHFLNQSMQAIMLNESEMKRLSGLVEEGDMIAQVTPEELQELQPVSSNAGDDAGLVQNESVNNALNRINVPPFQLFIDKAVDALQDISQLEFRVNDLTERYIRGEISIDEASIETNKLNLAISFATTVIPTASQTFKEFTSMAI